MTIVRQKEKILLSEKEKLAIERTIVVLADIILNSENDDTCDLATDAKILLIEILNNICKTE